MNSEALFYYIRLQTIFCLFLANALFVVFLERKDRFALRAIVTVAGGILLAILIAYLNIRLLYFLIDRNVRSTQAFPWINIVSHFILYLYSLFGLWFCFREKMITLIHVSIAAYATDNIAILLISLCSLIDPRVSIDIRQSVGVINVSALILSVGITYSMIYFTFARVLKDFKQVAEFNPSGTIFLFFVMLIVVIILRSYVSNLKIENKQFFAIVCILNIIVCFVILAEQFMTTKYIIQKREMETIIHLKEMQLAQYEFTKENIELINLKCHDIKHQLLALKQNGSIDEEYMKKLNDSVSFYDSIAKTGNQALDTVITEKKLYCAKNKIPMTVIADGEQVSFLAVSDLYSLFGNALDNAIEYVSRLAPEKRSVKLVVKKAGNFVSICTYNYYEGGALKLVNGLPKTSKPDSSLHGFGMKSIKLIAEQYGGSIHIRTEDNQFILSVLLPLPNPKN